MDLTQEPIPKLVGRIAVPASVGFFFHTMFNVVDTYFAGLVSTTALASLSIAFPVFFFIVAAGNGLATGATAVIGAALGAGERGRAAGLAVQAFLLALAAGAGLSFLGLSASPWLFSVLGAEGEYLTTALSYMNVIFSGAVFFMGVFMLNGVLNSLGETKPNRNFLIVASIVNIGLDPWFIYGGFGVPAMGLRGVALATVLVQAGGCVYLWGKVRKSGLLACTERRHCRPNLRAFWEILAQAVPASVNYLTIGLGIFVITYFIAYFGKHAVAAYGIATRVEQIVLMPTIGLNVATLSLAAQNGGAGRFGRVFETVRTTLLHGAWIMAIGTAVVFFGAGLLMRLFTDDPAVVTVGERYLRIAAFVEYGYVVLFVHVAALQGLKRPMFAVWIGLFRQVGAPVALFWLCTRVLDMGIMSIWWGIFSIVWFSAGVAFVYAWRVMRAVAAGEGVSDGRQ